MTAAALPATPTPAATGCRAGASVVEAQRCAHHRPGLAAGPLQPDVRRVDAAPRRQMDVLDLGRVPGQADLGDRGRARRVADAVVDCADREALFADRRA